MGNTATAFSERVFAVVPAAGHSRRMRQHKLLLPVQGQTVIRRLIDTLQAAEIRDVFVLVREEDHLLRNELATTTAHVRLATRSTADMRQSVALLLSAIEFELAPTERDAWLLTPADHPVLSVAVVRALISAWQAGRGPILVPTYHGRRGHPTLFAWEFASQVAAIPSDRGLDWLLRQQAASVDELPLDHPEVLFDLDTPADYQRLQSRPELSPDSGPPRVCDGSGG